MINYSIQVILFQIAFLTVYDFLLQKETFFKWNRLYLLVTALISFLIPLIKFDGLQKSLPNQLIFQLPTVFLNPEKLMQKSNNEFFQIDNLSIVFYVGLVFFIVFFLVKVFKLIKIVIRSEVIKKDNFTLILLTEKQSAFSFFNYIFISKHLLESNDLDIIKHELVHSNHYHTIDLLFFELLKIVMWFNPMLYVYSNRITLLHEYIADAETVKNIDKNNYFNKLLAETFNVENITFVNQFFKQTLIKKRIVMITKNKSKKMKQLKYLLILPLLLSMLLLSSFGSKSNDSDKEFLTITQQINDSIKPQETVPFALIEKAPVFPACSGTEAEIRKCLQENITKIVNTNFNSNLANELNLEKGLQRIFVMFKIDKQGNVTDIKAKASHKKLEEEAIRVIKLIPKMIPGKQKGKPVNVKYSLPIAFMVGDKDINAKEEFTKQTIYNSKETPLIFLNGKEITSDEMKKIDANSIKSVNVIKGENALQKYGDKGKNGVLIITLKK